MCKEVSYSNGCTANLWNNKTVQISCKESAIIICALAAIVIGSLWVTGIYDSQGYGVIFPGSYFGAAVEGGVLIGVGVLALPIILHEISKRVEERQPAAEQQ